MRNAFYTIAIRNFVLPESSSSVPDDDDDDDDDKNIGLRQEPSQGV